MSNPKPSFLSLWDLFLDISPGEFDNLVQQMSFSQKEQVLECLKYAYDILNSDYWRENIFQSFPRFAWRKIPQN